MGLSGLVYPAPAVARSARQHLHGRSEIVRSDWGCCEESFGTYCFTMFGSTAMNFVGAFFFLPHRAVECRYWSNVVRKIGLQTGPKMIIPAMIGAALSRLLPSPTRPADNVMMCRFSQCGASQTCARETNR